MPEVAVAMCDSCFQVREHFYPRDQKNYLNGFMKNLNVFVFRCVVGRTLLDTY